MKRYLYCLLILLISITLVGGGKEKKYRISIVNFNDISSITIDTLSQYDNIKEFNDKDDMKIIYNMINNRETNIESISDNPNNPDMLFYITFKISNGNNLNFYVYRRDNKYYIEQSYNGIYEIEKEDFEVIQNLVE